MKIILTGTSGFIGKSILSQCLLQLSITSIIIISRRPIPSILSLDSRIKVNVLEDFLLYPKFVIHELSDATACIWSLGGSNSNPTPVGKNDEVEVQYPIAAAKALIAASNSKESGGMPLKLRFLFISGTLSERDQKKPLLFLEEGRKARGMAETKLVELTEQHQDVFEAVIVKAAYVLKRENVIPEVLVGLSRSAIRVDELAAAMIEIAVGEAKVSSIISNADLRERGRALLRKS